jgi:hypothetical protein
LKDKKKIKTGSVQEYLTEDSSEDKKPSLAEQIGGKQVTILGQSIPGIQVNEDGIILISNQPAYVPYVNISGYDNSTIGAINASTITDYDSPALDQLRVTGAQNNKIYNDQLTISTTGTSQKIEDIFSNENLVKLRKAVEAVSKGLDGWTKPTNVDISQAKAFAKAEVDDVEEEAEAETTKILKEELENIRVSKDIKKLTKKMLVTVDSFIKALKYFDDKAVEISSRNGLPSVKIRLNTKYKSEKTKTVDYFLNHFKSQIVIAKELNLILGEEVYSSFNKIKEYCSSGQQTNVCEKDCNISEMFNSIKMSLEHQLLVELNKCLLEIKEANLFYKTAIDSFVADNNYTALGVISEKRKMHLDAFNNTLKEILEESKSNNLFDDWTRSSINLMSQGIHYQELDNLKEQLIDKMIAHKTDKDPSDPKGEEEIKDKDFKNMMQEIEKLGEAVGMKPSNAREELIDKQLDASRKNIEGYLGQDKRVVQKVADALKGKDLSALGLGIKQSNALDLSTLRKNDIKPSLSDISYSRDRDAKLSQDLFLELEKYLSKDISFKSKLKKEGLRAANVIAATQITNATAKVLSSYIIPLVDKTDEQNISSFLESDFGKSILSLALGVSLTKYKQENPGIINVANIAEECRINAMTNAGSILISELMDNFVPMLKSMIDGLPEPVRVEQVSQEEFVEKDDLDYMFSDDEKHEDMFENV